MRIVSFTEARNSLKAVLDGVVNDDDTTVITRRDSEDAVVMSLDYYNSLMETVHLVALAGLIEFYQSNLHVRVIAYLFLVLATRDLKIG